MTTLIEACNKAHISDKLISISSIYKSNSSYKLYYNPPYQRNYVWTEVKATYFIETILLHGEIPPIVIFDTTDVWEVVDGRQRCETIEKFINDGFSLKRHGLDKLWYLSDKKFSQLDVQIQNRILDTRLRFIVFATNDAGERAQIKDAFTREIFKRYNLGISPLRKEEVFLADYLHNDLNNHFKNNLLKNDALYEQVTSIFDHKTKSIETLMQHIRQMLVLHKIPISNFSYDRDDIANKYFHLYSLHESRDNKGANIESIFNEFLTTINYLSEIKGMLDKIKHGSNGFLFDCLFWALSVTKSENGDQEIINSAQFKNRLIQHFIKHFDKYTMYRTNLSTHIKMRYRQIALFFSQQLNLSFEEYLSGTINFKKAQQAFTSENLPDMAPEESNIMIFTKAEPTKYTVTDIIDRMKKGRFDLRPPYQRGEVMNVAKASSLIESILLGIKIHPIFVFVRKDGVFEVIDGQQRLLSILGYLGEQYLNPNGKYEYSKKNKFRLNLHSGLLTDLNNKSFERLSDANKRKIRNFDLNIIEIKESENATFKSEELFKRLNYKPYPIKPNSFEYWNAYANPDIIKSIKEILQRYPWLHLKKADNRMLNEELMTSLLYLHFLAGTESPTLSKMREFMAIFRTNSQIAIRITNKAHITSLLENRLLHKPFITSFNSFESGFIEKLRILTENLSSKTTDAFRSHKLDLLLERSVARSSMGFYVLWLALQGIPVEKIADNRADIKSKISRLFSLIKNPDAVGRFDNSLTELWAQYGKATRQNKSLATA